LKNKLLRVRSRGREREGRVGRVFKERKGEFPLERWELKARGKKKKRAASTPIKGEKPAGLPCQESAEETNNLSMTEKKGGERGSHLFVFYRQKEKGEKEYII